MIDEKQLSDNMALFDKNQETSIKFMMVEIVEMAETLRGLWKVARSVRKWQRAMPGLESVNAEAEMIERLDALRVND